MEECVEATSLVVGTNGLDWWRFGCGAPNTGIDDEDVVVSRILLARLRRESKANTV